ncbi:MAG: GNAT family N-acetyltransferase [Clostridia bacterium]|nr:GNAT family N-acetyltransferase [Clostridia bacterium]
MIRKTDDYEKLVEMFIRNDLEFSEDDPLTTTDIVQCWEAIDDSGKLIGGCVLALREGEYIIDGIAVEPEYQKTGIGAKLLNTVIDYLKAVKATKLYLVARAPAFFKTQGFEAISREAAPEFFECFGCDQYQVSCFPEVMLLKI